MRPLWGIERLGTLPTVCHPPSGYMRCESDRVVFDRNLCKARHLMKRLLAPLLFVLTLLAVVPAQAHGGGWHGGGYGYGYGHHGGGYRNGWVAPVLGAALVGSVIYAANSPHYVVSPPVVVSAPPVYPSRVAYFCGTTQQYYPNVPSCDVPWQPVSY